VHADGNFFSPLSQIKTKGGRLIVLICIILVCVPLDKFSDDYLLLGERLRLLIHSSPLHSPSRSSLNARRIYLKQWELAAIQLLKFLVQYCSCVYIIYM
jgi:uncharacterized membrane protein